MEVQGRRVDVAVPEEFGEGREIGPREELQGREGVPEGVGRGLLRELGHFAQALDAALNGADRDAGPAGRDEEGALARDGVHRALGDPVDHEGEGALIEGHLAERPALAFDAEHRRGHEIDLVEFERDELMDPKARLREQGDDGQVAGTILGAEFVRDRTKAALKLVRREDRRDAGGLPHEGDLLGRVALPAELLLREGGEDLERRELLVPGRGRTRKPVVARPAEEGVDLDAGGHLGGLPISPEEREERRDDGGVHGDRAGAPGLGAKVPLEGGEGVGHTGEGDPLTLPNPLKTSDLAR